MQHRQRVNGSEHQTKGGDHGNDRHHFEAAEQDHKFADEVTGAWHTQRGHREEHRERWQPFNFAPQTAHHTHVTGVKTFVQLTTQDEETGCGQTVRNHLDNRTLVSQLAAGVDGNQYKAHVGNGGVRNQTFNVVLREGHPGTVEDTDHTKPHRNWRELSGRIREQRQSETQQTVGRGFQQDPRQVNGTRRWCL